MALFITLRNSSLTGTEGAPAKSLSGSMGCVGNRHGLIHFGDSLIDSRRDDEEGDPLPDCLGEELLNGDAIEMFAERNNTTNVKSNTNCCCRKCSTNQ